MNNKILNLENKLILLTEDYTSLKKENENFKEVLKEKDKNVEMLVKSVSDSFLHSLKREEETHNTILFEYVFLNNIRRQIDNLLNENQNFQSFCNIKLISSMYKLTNLLQSNNNYNEELQNLKRVLINNNLHHDQIFSPLDINKGY